MSEPGMGVCVCVCACGSLCGRVRMCLCGAVDAGMTHGLRVPRSRRPCALTEEVMTFPLGVASHPLITARTMSEPGMGVCVCVYVCVWVSVWACVYVSLWCCGCGYAWHTHGLLAPRSRLPCAPGAGEGPSHRGGDDLPPGGGLAPPHHCPALCQSQVWACAYICLPPQHLWV